MTCTTVLLALSATILLSSLFTIYVYSRYFGLAYEHHTTAFLATLYQQTLQFDFDLPTLPAFEFDLEALWNLRYFVSNFADFTDPPVVLLELSSGFSALSFLCGMIKPVVSILNYVFEAWEILDARCLPLGEVAHGQEDFSVFLLQRFGEVNGREEVKEREQARIEGACERIRGRFAAMALCIEEDPLEVSIEKERQLTQGAGRQSTGALDIEAVDIEAVPGAP